MRLIWRPSGPAMLPLRSSRPSSTPFGYGIRSVVHPTFGRFRIFAYGLQAFTKSKCYARSAVEAQWLLLPAISTLTAQGPATIRAVHCGEPWVMRGYEVNGRETRPVAGSTSRSADQLCSYGGS